jgi:hypothetical protein
MRVLRSIKKCETPIELIEFDVNELMLIPNQKWIQKRYPNFKDSAEKVGMIWPIIVTDREHYWQHEKNWPKDVNGNYIEGKMVHTGNKRVMWAKENGYTHIEGYFVSGLDEKNKIVKQTFIHKTQFPKSLPQFFEVYKK